MEKGEPEKTLEEDLEVMRCLEKLPKGNWRPALADLEVGLDAEAFPLPPLPPLPVAGI